MTPEEIAKLPYRRNVGVMLMNADGHVFVGQRLDNPGPAWQMPQGGIDKGETPKDAALRELEEETGYRAGRMEKIGEFFSSPGMVSESFTLFRAHDLVKVGEGGGVDSEDIVVHRVPLPGIEQAIAAYREDGYAIDVKILSLLGPKLLG